MLDIKLIREKPDYVKAGILKKGVDPKVVDELISIDKNRRRIIKELERSQLELNRRSKDIAKLYGQQKIDAINVASMYSNKVKTLKPEADKAEEEFREFMLCTPNIPEEDVIEGRSGADNKVNRKWGQPKKFDYKIKDHLELGEKLDLIDVERAGKTSGSRFYFLKNQLVMMEFALIQYVFEILIKEKFIPLTPPVLLNRAVMEGAGYIPGGEDEIYKTQDNLYLAGTSEQAVAGYHMGEVLDQKRLPLRYVAFSSCFRREAGSHGQDVRGILRTHQFDKVEMFSFVLPKNSKKEHQYLISLEEKIVQGLNLPYQVVDICAGDLGAPASKKYDIEIWMPGQKKYRETHSCSNCSDFQARRLNIRYKLKDGTIEFIHTLNGTAIAIGRTLIAIMENYQRKDGTIEIPKVLQKWTGFREISGK